MICCKGGHKKYKGKQHKRRAVAPPENVDEASDIIKLFRQCQTQLDSRHDKHERIVKHSRDITIESKRAIFLLHRIYG